MPEYFKQRGRVWDSQVYQRYQRFGIARQEVSVEVKSSANMLWSSEFGSQSDDIRDKRQVE